MSPQIESKEEIARAEAAELASELHREALVRLQDVQAERDQLVTGLQAEIERLRNWRRETYLAISPEPIADRLQQLLQSNAQGGE